MVCTYFCSKTKTANINAGGGKYLIHPRPYLLLIISIEIELPSFIRASSLRGDQSVYRG
jgi:hypothetical protein